MQTFDGLPCTSRYYKGVGRMAICETCDSAESVHIKQGKKLRAPGKKGTIK